MAERQKEFDEEDKQDLQKVGGQSCKELITMNSKYRVTSGKNQFE